MVKAILFPLVAGILCIVLATILKLRVGPALDLYVFGVYFVVSVKILLIAGIALVAAALVLVVAH
jgi:hypothetical protein